MTTVFCEIIIRDGWRRDRTASVCRCRCIYDTYRILNLKEKTLVRILVHKNNEKKFLYFTIWIALVINDVNQDNNESLIPIEFNFCESKMLFTQSSALEINVSITSACDPY